MEEAIIALLLASDGVTQEALNRVTPGERTQGAALPAVVVNAIDGDADMTHDGPSGQTRTRIQVDSYGATYADAKALDRAVNTALNGFKGDVVVEGETFTLQGVFGGDGPR